MQAPDDVAASLRGGLDAGVVAGVPAGSVANARRTARTSPNYGRWCFATRSAASATVASQMPWAGSFA
jgi:hypothetical protein